MLSLHPRRRGKDNPENPQSGTSVHLVLACAYYLLISETLMPSVVCIVVIFKQVLRIQVMAL